MQEHVSMAPEQLPGAGLHTGKLFRFVHRCGVSEALAPTSAHAITARSSEAYRGSTCLLVSRHLYWTDIAHMRHEECKPDQLVRTAWT